MKKENKSGIKRKAFSFFALILVLVLVGGVTAVSIPYFTDTTKNAKEVVKSIQIAQNESQSNVNDIINPPITQPSVPVNPPPPPPPPAPPPPPPIDESNFYLSNVYRYGRTLLNSTEQQAYDEIISQAIKFNRINNKNPYMPQLYFTLKSNINYNTLLKITRLIKVDCPECFHIVNFIPRPSRYSGGFVKEFWVNVFASYDTREKYINTLSTILNKITPIINRMKSKPSELEKIKIAHDEFLKMVRYGGMSSTSAGNIRGAFIDNIIVCEGYSMGLLLLLQRGGLKGLYTAGYIKQNDNDSGFSTMHAWNAVLNSDGKWYYIDSTWDDGFASQGNAVYHRYFMKGKADFKKDHSYKNGTISAQSYNPMPNISQTSF